MKKIVELLIKREDLELEELGVDVVSLVENPAIGYEWFAFSEDAEQYVDNKGFEKYKKFLDDNQELFKKPGGGPAGDGGVDHGEQMKKLEEAGYDAGYPFGYCFQISQFLFYMLGGYKSEYNLMCIKGMEYKVDGMDFKSTHWFVQDNDGRIIDLSAEQFDGILDINEYYKDARRANLGFPYYNVEDKKVEFENTVPSLQTLKLYAAWKEEHGENKYMEEFYQASKYEELRANFTEEDFEIVDQEFVYPELGESKDAFIGRCMGTLDKEYPNESQRAAVCYAYWEKENLEDIDINALSDAIVVEAQKLGQDLIPGETTILKAEDFANENTVGAVTDAVKALDILSKRASNEELQTVYKYEGPISSNSRKFCRAMVGLSRTKVFTREDIDRMTQKGVNAAFNSPIRGGNYDIFRYAGGSRCKHHWAEYKMFKGSDGKTLLIATGVTTTRPADMSNDGFVNQRQKKKADQWYAIQQNFQTIDEEQRIVVAPAMVPDVLIKRRNMAGEEYFVYFTKETIKQIAEKFFKNNYQNNTDINHDGAVTKDNTLLESWIVEDPTKDKSSIYGFEVPKGTWMLSMRINDDETWKKIKTGELKGYSISGNFIEMTK